MVSSDGCPRRSRATGPAARRSGCRPPRCARSRSMPNTSCTSGSSASGYGSSASSESIPCACSSIFLANYPSLLRSCSTVTASLVPGRWRFVNTPKYLRMGKPDGGTRTHHRARSTASRQHSPYETAAFAHGPALARLVRMPRTRPPLPDHRSSGRQRLYPTAAQRQRTRTASAMTTAPAGAERDSRTRFHPAENLKVPSFSQLLPLLR